MIRLFVSIDLPEDVKQRLAFLSCDVPGARWVEPEQMHLTVRFVGEVEEPVYRDLIGALEEIRAPGFDLTLRGVGHFPPRGEPRSLWVGVDRSEALVRLRNRVDSAVVRVGVAPEGRKFTPHVTLARLRGAPERAVGSFLAMQGLLRFAPFRVRDFHLDSSRLGAKRAAYRREASFALDEAEEGGS